MKVFQVRVYVREGKGKNMRLINSFALAGCLLVSVIQAENMQPEDVRSIAKDRRSSDWYMAQAGIWKKQTENNPKDDRAWRNYYFAVRYANFDKEGSLSFSKDKKSVLAEIVERMTKAAPTACNTYFVRMFDKPVEEPDLNLVREARRAFPESMELAEQSVFVYEVCDAREEMKKACKQIYRAGLLENSLLDFCYNLVVSPDSGAILFTNGDNDTYPLWILQKAMGIREDVLVLNRAVIFSNKSYLLNKLKDKKIGIPPEALPSTQDPTQYLARLCDLIKNQHPITPLYFAVTINDLETLKSNLYNVGLASAYSTFPLDNIALLRRNFETRYRLDNLFLDWQEDKKPSGIKSADVNYIYPLLILMRHYKITGETEKLVHWKQLAACVLEKTGNQKALPLLKKEFE
jgi:hypothetical protein